MTVNTAIKISFQDPEIYDFITGAEQSFTTDAPAHDDFSEAGRQDNPHSEGFPAQRVQYMVTETYQVIQRTSVAGTVTASVVFSHDVAITPVHILHLRDSLDEPSRLRARSLMNLYKSIDGDFTDWLAKQLKGDWIRTEDFIIDVVGRLEKKTTAPIEINTSQRDALHRLYGIKNPPIHAMFEYPGSDSSFDSWAKNRGTTLRLIGVEAMSLKASGKPDTSLVVHELKPDQQMTEADVNNIVNSIVSILVPTSCGNTTSEKFPLLSVSNWPEFKLEWITVSVKIGCARVDISVPVLRTRSAKMVVFVRYQRPEKIELTVWQIVKTCAIRGALVGTVTGIILANPAAALVAFETAFKDCVKEEIVACLHPGVFLVKEVTDWV